MAHPVENTSTTVDCKSVCTTTWLNYVNNVSQSYPCYIKKGRAASVHTVKGSDGWRPPTAYWGYRWQTPYRTRLSFDIGSANRTSTNGIGYNFGGNAFSTAYQPPDRARLEQILINRALIKLKGRKFNLATSLGEGRETLRMLRTTVKRVTDFVR